MDKKSLSERDICTKFITPALRRAGWDEMTQIREEVSFTKGRLIVRGKLVSRGKGKRADYILAYKPNIPIALIEAKDNNHAIGDGMQQGPRLRRHPRHPLRVLFQRRRLRIPRPHRRQRRPGKRRSRSTPFRHRTTCGRGTAPGRDWRRRPRPSSCRIITTTAAARRRAITRPSAINRRHRGHRQGTRPRVARHGDPEPVRPIPRFRLSGGSGRRGARNASCSLADRNVLVDQTKVNDFRPFEGRYGQIVDGGRNHLSVMPTAGV